MFIIPNVRLFRSTWPRIAINEDAREIASIVCDFEQMQALVGDNAPPGGDELLVWPIDDAGTRTFAALRCRLEGSPDVIEWASLPGMRCCNVRFDVKKRRLRSDTVVSIRCDATVSEVMLRSTLVRLKARAESASPQRGVRS